MIWNASQEPSLPMSASCTLNGGSRDVSSRYERGKLTERSKSISTYQERGRRTVAYIPFRHPSIGLSYHAAMGPCFLDLAGSGKVTCIANGQWLAVSSIGDWIQ